MRNLKLIIVREYLARVRNRTFVVMTFLSPVIFVLMIMLIAYLTSLSQSETRTVGIHDESGIFLPHFEDSEDVKFQDFSGLSLEQARTLVTEGEFYGLLIIPPLQEAENETDAEVAERLQERSETDGLQREVELAGELQFLAKEAPGFGFLERFEEVIGTELTKRRLVANGINPQTITAAEAAVSIEVKDFSGKSTSEISGYVKMFFGGAAGYLLMMFIIIYGNMVMRSVIEEKTNRIVEIIISSVKPIHLMFGKILGTSLAGITQFLIWVVLGSIMLMLLSAVSGIDLAAAQAPQAEMMDQMQVDTMQQLTRDILDLPLLTLTVAFLVYFIGGYFLYSAIYAAIGAAVDNETDTQQFIFPLILPLMLGIYVGFFAVIENPHGSISTIFSLIPLTSPIVMLMRIPFGVPWWELAVSILLLVISIGAAVWLAAKIYRIGILMYGKKPGYKEIIKWLKY